MTANLFMGIDVGTQGVRVLVVDTQGRRQASASQPLPRSSAVLPPGWFEQEATSWWTGVKACIQKTMSDLKARGYHAEDVIALSVDSTSGTILPIDETGRALHPALMYNDSRSASVLQHVRQSGGDLEKKLGYAFKSSFALPKIVWLHQNEPELFDRSARFIHATDYITGCLSGDFSLSDHSNALKTGFDLIDYKWPSFIEEELDVPLGKLPHIVSPGTPIGHVSSRAAYETGLSTTTQIVAGMTDGTASQMASGAVTVGEWNSTLGTTLVIKGISRDLLKDPLGRFYSHLHPQGMWMPGGASNTGAEWISKGYPGQNPSDLVAQAARHLPTNLIAYPLVRRGERFPFVAPEAQGFIVGTPQDPFEQFAAEMEGVAYLERLAYETLENLGAKVGETIYVTGGGARSDLWLKVRASVLGRQMARPALGEAAMGAALLAASQTLYQSLDEAARHMVSIETVVEPDPQWEAIYEERYQAFFDACRTRGYIT